MVDDLSFFNIFAVYLYYNIMLYTYIFVNGHQNHRPLPGKQTATLYFSRYTNEYKIDKNKIQVSSTLFRQLVSSLLMVQDMIES